MRAFPLFSNGLSLAFGSPLLHIAERGLLVERELSFLSRPQILTPTDLKALRLLLGLDLEQAASLYGVLPSTVRAVERGRQKKIFQNWINALEELESKVEAFTRLARMEDGLIVVYTNDDDFARWEPMWKKQLHFASVHMAAAMALKYTLGYPISLIEFSEHAYWEYVKEQGLPEEGNHLARWAVSYSGRYSVFSPDGATSPSDPSAPESREQSEMHRS